MLFESIDGISPSILAIFNDIPKLSGISPSIYQNEYLSNFTAEKADPSSLPNLKERYLT
jgi:hypothetical protein